MWRVVLGVYNLPDHEICLADCMGKVVSGKLSCSRRFGRDFWVVPTQILYRVKTKLNLKGVIFEYQLVN